VIDIPEIVPADISFDLFDFPAEHPARSQSDTYYIDGEHILRTHDTVFWYYYLNHPVVKSALLKVKLWAHSAMAKSTVKTRSTAAT